MKCIIVCNATKHYNTYRNIEESLNIAVRDSIPILIDDSNLYHEISGHLFIKNIPIDLTLVVHNKTYSYQLDSHKDNDRVMLITNQFYKYKLLNQERPYTSKLGTLYYTKDGEQTEPVMFTYLDIVLSPSW